MAGVMLVFGLWFLFGVALAALALLILRAEHVASEYLRFAHGAPYTVAVSPPPPAGVLGAPPTPAQLESAACAVTGASAGTSSATGAASSMWVASPIINQTLWAVFFLIVALAGFFTYTAPLLPLNWTLARYEIVLIFVTAGLALIYVWTWVGPGGSFLYCATIPLSLAAVVAFSTMVAVFLVRTWAGIIMLLALLILVYQLAGLFTIIRKIGHARNSAAYAQLGADGGIAPFCQQQQQQQQQRQQDTVAVLPPPGATMT